MSGEPLARPEAILFDWDSTLVDNWTSVTLAMNMALESCGLAPWSEEDMRRRAKKSMRDSFPAIFGERWEEARDTFYRGFAEVHIRGLKPLPGAETLLRAMQERGVPMGVVSNKTGRYLRAEADHLGWSGYFRRVVGATDATRDKPAPDPVHLALEPTGLSAGRHVWFVGDSLVDVQCAHASGCTAILVGAEEIPAADLDRWPPDAHFSDCNAMLGALMD